MNQPDRRTVSDCVILAGGLGTRMGQPKALLELDGVTLLKRQHDQLSALFPRISVALKDRSLLDSFEDLSWHRVLLDPPGSRCLVDVIESIVERLAVPVFVAAVDLPLLDSSTVSTICSHHSPGISVIPVDDHRPQPLAAVWDPSALKFSSPPDGDLALLAWVKRSSTRLLHWPEQFSPASDPPTQSPFKNLNSPTDLDSWGSIA
ncbi:MAG: molybdenum cofactor guanylyltransferase [Planctomycetota bacterium]|nr:molybdenum cofactor guanylyltransferase [Planctomycetota bacterium]